jgi:hypothetical protein
MFAKKHSLFEFFLNKKSSWYINYFSWSTAISPSFKNSQIREPLLHKKKKSRRRKVLHPPHIKIDP